MKTILTFIGFCVASVLAGIGIEETNNLALFAGLFFMAISFALVLSPTPEETKN